mmetsp:Transcript_27474/g.77143  ORF Transcript_27474/g.77143 Transcript_27474/m.77143 type:complete len:200 (-) Transcript_27474:664-1263(-)
MPPRCRAPGRRCAIHRALGRVALVVQHRAPSADHDIGSVAVVGAGGHPRRHRRHQWGGADPQSLREAAAHLSDQVRRYREPGQRLGPARRLHRLLGERHRRLPAAAGAAWRRRRRGAEDDGSCHGVPAGLQVLRRRRRRGQGQRLLPRRELPVAPRRDGDAGGRDRQLLRAHEPAHLHGRLRVGLHRSRGLVGEARGVP